MKSVLSSIVHRLFLGQGDLLRRTKIQHYHARDATTEVSHYWPPLVAMWLADEQHFARSSQRVIVVLEPVGV